VLSRKVHAVTVTYWSFFSCFTGELFTFKAQLDAFVESAVANLAEFVLSCYASNSAVWASAILHFWAFLASNTAYTNSHAITLVSLIYTQLFKGILRTDVIGLSGIN
jgi:hypothetical protein